MPDQVNAGTTTQRLRPLGLSLTFACCFALYCAFVEHVSVPELVLATGVSAACTYFATLLVRCTPAVQFAWRDVAQCWRVPGYIVQRVGQISWLLLQDFGGRRVHSIFRQTPFRGEWHNADHAGKRVLATTYTTAAPNFIVLQIDAHEHQLHFHQLTRNEPSKMLQNLGAKP